MGKCAENGAGEYNLGNSPSCNEFVMRGFGQVVLSSCRSTFTRSLSSPSLTTCCLSECKLQRCRLSTTHSPRAYRSTVRPRPLLPANSASPDPPSLVASHAAVDSGLHSRDTWDSIGQTRRGWTALEGAHLAGGLGSASPGRAVSLPWALVSPTHDLTTTVD